VGNIHWVFVVYCDRMSSAETKSLISGSNNNENKKDFYVFLVFLIFVGISFNKG
jgi:hypothetical protein